MDKITILETHINIAMAHFLTVLVLCMCGMLLNVIMLVIFFKRKQVRGSIYTMYMIQIAVTDVLVCIVWVVMTAMYLDELPSKSEVYEALNAEPRDPVASVKDSAAIESKNFYTYRFTYAVYNFHYYNNIFLLATMSVERCVAVWKSLKCQRYQFNRKFIYGVSAVMWLLAFVCALPSFVNPDLITQSEQTDLLLRDLNVSKPKDSGLADKAPSSALTSCYEPLRHAFENNESYVSDYDGVSVLDCLRIMEDYGYRYGEAKGGKPNVDDAMDSNWPDEEHPNYTDFYEPTSDTYNSFEIGIAQYHRLFYESLKVVTVRVRTGDIDDLCDPRLSESAKYYQVAVNLIIGFFIPFIAIVVTNFAIAFMICNRARRRLENDSGDDEREDSAVRRMSDFLRQFGQRSESKTEGETTAMYKRSPVMRGKAKARHQKEKEQLKEQKKLLNEHENHNAHGARINIQSATPMTSPNVKSREARPRLSSFSTTQTRRVSGGSASSAESFPTDLTSLHTTSPSPGVRLSAPLFLHGDGKVLIQRAYSADNSATGSGSSQGNTVPVQRWSSEVFKPSPAYDERKSKSDYEGHQKDTEHEYDFKHATKKTSPLPSRAEKVADDSKQLVHGSHTRLYEPKPKGKNRQTSQSSHSRGRVFAAVSKSSAGGKGTRKTLVHKNAERQMRVSKSVLVYVLVFTLCWLPQRITTIIYFTEGLMGKGGQFCHIIVSTTRIISFFSVLLNPIVYAFTQRDIRHYFRQTVNRLCKCLCLHKWLRRKIPSTKKAKNGGPQNNAGISGKENGNFSAGVMNNVTSEEATRQERHARNKKRWSQMVQRLGRKNFRLSMSASALTTKGDKQSDGTIDEEREEDKGLSSKCQSSSNSFKLVVGGWEDWKQLIDMASTKTNESQKKDEETLQ